MKHYYQLEIPYNANNEEKLYNLIYKHGFKSILDENGFLILTQPEEGLKKFISLINELNHSKLTNDHKLVLDRLEYQNWNKEWEKSIEPVYIKNKIVVTPSWHKKKIKKQKDLIVITIDPKMSFGTGHNETTQLILEMMVDHISSVDKTMLDYGTGTGILAIAGIKLGLKSVTAVDIDEDSIMNARDYIKEHRLSKKIKLIQCDITGINQKNFDLITANINKTVISKNIKEIYKRLRKDGKLLITGILESEDKTIKNVLRKNNFKLIETRRRSEWFSYLAIRP